MWDFLKWIVGRTDVEGCLLICVMFGLPFLAGLALFIYKMTELIVGA